MYEKIYDEIYSSGHWINIGPATYTRYLLLKKITKWNRNDVILDAGCGSGRFIKLLSPFVKEVHGIDISGKALKIARSYKIKNAIIRKGNVLKIPYRDNSFDKVICIDVIEHIKDDKKVLKELKRVVKPYGEILVYFVTGPLSHVHFHSYCIESIKNLAKICKLKIEKILIHRSVIDDIVNPLRNPKTSKLRKRVGIISKTLSFITLFECKIPFLKPKGYLVKLKKIS
jgi:ubiquinone/menaquinone biosynthesis C-methylase UbiE